MGKVNVYLPDWLEQQVRQAQVSVSPVCQRALEEEVKRVNAQRAITSELEKAAERLRGTRTQSDVDFEEGRELGTRWAKEAATVAELEVMYSLSGENVLRLDVDEADWETLYNFLDNELPGRHNGRISFTIDPFTEGLIAGAVGVFEAVAPLLKPSHRAQED
jgi:hypothetical protein